MLSDIVYLVLKSWESKCVEFEFKEHFLRTHKGDKRDNVQVHQALLSGTSLLVGFNIPFFAKGEPSRL